MANNEQWTATNRVTLRDPVSGETLCDPDSGEALDAVAVMVIDDRKAYQEHEWELGGYMGDPDIMRDPDGSWTYRVECVLATFEPICQHLKPYYRPGRGRVCMDCNADLVCEHVHTKLLQSQALGRQSAPATRICVDCGIEL